MISTTDNYNVFEDPIKDIDTNLVVLMETLQECKDKDITFNFVSSWFVYGDSEIPAKESHPCNPKGFYSITKKAAEDLLISFCKTFEIEYRIFRLSNVIGKGDKFSKKKNALNYLAERIANDEDIGLYYGGDFIRDYIHVDDVCRALKIAMSDAPINQILNIGSGNPYVFRDLIKRLVEFTGSKSLISPIDPPEFHNLVQVKDMYLDTTNLQNLGFSTEISIDSALSELVS